MAVFKAEARIKVDIDKKPRVYFTCHPDDFEKYFKKICEDIFNAHDCAIYYTEDMTEVIAEDEKAVDLGRNNLFVVPVTFKLLTTPNRAMGEDIPYALKEHIPVLPIIMEPGIDKIYSKPDNFGELQYLNPYSTDPTEISYEEKLKKHLESVLISDELAMRIRKAFDAYIFLSYRKKDRKYANELMRLIHSNPECRDLAVWFDEFLTPGESFKENIEKILDDCKLFTLLVTPRLLEKVIDENGEERDNYILSTELPLARKKKKEKGIDIFAVEMEQTDKNALSAICVEDCVSAKDAEFQARLLQSVCHMAITSNDTPEHNFLIGLAYLEGIDVEVNKARALELITLAAERGLPEAMQRLYEMYRDGIGVPLNYKNAAVWAERYCKHITARYSKLLPKGIEAMHQLAEAYEHAGFFDKSFKLRKEVYIYQRITGGRRSHNTLVAKARLAGAYSTFGAYKKALKMQQKIYAFYCRKYGKAHYKAFNCLNDIAYTYSQMGDYENAVKLQKEAAVLAYDTLGEEHPETSVYIRNLTVYLSETGDYEMANAFAEKIHALSVKNFGDEHPQTIFALHTLAGTIGNFGDYEEAAELQEKAYALSCKVLGEEHPYTITILSDCAYYDYQSERYEEANRKLENAYALSRKVLGDMDPQTNHLLGYIAATLVFLKRYSEAVDLCEKAYSRLCKVREQDHPRTLDVLQNMVKAYFMSDDTQTAWRYCKRLYSQCVKVYGENHTKTQAAKADLSYLEQLLK